MLHFAVSLEQPDGWPGPAIYWAMTKSGAEEQLTAQIPPKPQDFRLSGRNHGISYSQRILHTGATSMISIASSEIKETAESITFEATYLLRADGYQAIVLS